MPDRLSDTAPGALGDLARVRVELASRVARLTRLEGIGAIGAPMADITEILTEVVRSLVDLLEADGGALLVQGREGALDLVAAHRLAPEVEASLREHGPVAEVAGEVQRQRVDFDMLTLAGDAMGRIALYFRDDPALDAGLIEAAQEQARQAAELVERARMHGEARGLAALERRRGEQLRGLADAALALSAETEVEELLRLVTEYSRELIGVHQGVTSRLVHGWSNATTHVSLSEKYARWRTYDETPKGLGVLNAVTRENRPLRLTGTELVAHPEFRGLADAPDHPPMPDYLAAPLIARDGRNLGLIQLSDKIDGTPFTAEDEAILVQLAQMASVSIENAELIGRERGARREAERQARLQRILSQASHAFSMSLDLEQTLSTVTRTMVPEFADWCGVLLLDSAGRLQLKASAALDGVIDDQMRDLIARTPFDPGRPVGSYAVIRTGDSQLLPSVPRELLEMVASPALPLEDLAPLEGASVIVVPLPARGSNVGVLTLLRRGEKPYGDDELGFAEDLARRAALAVENATSYELERQAADMLLRNLLPRRLPLVADVMTGVRYRPGAAGARIGGDWYDMFPLGDGVYALVVGDVMGHGVAAASSMGQMRSAVRAYALEGHRPGAVLDRLDSLVQQLEEMALTTCVYATFDAGERRLTVASAGHLPPLVVSPSTGASLVEVRSGLPLGVGLGQGGYEEVQVTLGEDETFLLYTDGLVESRTASIDDGLERLRRAAGELAERTPQQLCDGLLEAMADPSHHDDIALLAVREGTGGARAAEDQGEDEVLDSVGVALLLDRRSPARARAFVREHLAEWGFAAVADEVVLMTSELVTNAQLHGDAPLDVRLQRLPGRVRIEVEDGSDRMPTVHDYGLEAGTGRGMLLLHSLASRWGAEPTPGGKVVWFEVAT